MKISSLKSVFKILNREICLQGMVKTTIKKTSVQNKFITKWLLPFASIENLTKDTWQVFPVRKIFPFCNKTPSGKNLPSGKSCQLNQKNVHKF